MGDGHDVQVIATTISGSIKDWGKVERILPLFREYGRDDVSLHVLDSHLGARKCARDLAASGCTHVISAGGSGTFNSVLEGCIEAGVGLERISLGFLRKGSADLLGKVLGMPDEIVAAIRVFVTSIAEGRTVPCDVIRAESGEGRPVPRHFVGYGGAEIFGRIPHYTENRFMKYYKGILSQFFGDLGPFGLGASLSALERTFGQFAGKPCLWTIAVDGVERARGRYQAMIIVNGDLGPDFPFARSVPLGSGDFYLFALRDLGPGKLLAQFRRAFDGTILDDPEAWGLETHRAEGTLTISPSGGGIFPVNVDGSTLMCRGCANFRIVDQIKLISRE